MVALFIGTHKDMNVGKNVDILIAAMFGAIGFVVATLGTPLPIRLGSAKDATHWLEWRVGVG